MRWELIRDRKSEDFESYRVDPVHVEVAQYIGGVMGTAASFCSETGDV